MTHSGKITIREIANLACTSKTTVSFYLNGKTEKMSEKTRQKIAEVIKETNYKPSIAARSLNSKSSKLLGIMIGDITNTFSNQIVKGIEDIASKKGYQLIVANSNYDYSREGNLIDRMLSMGVDGFIVQPTIQFKEISKKAKKPMVFFDSNVNDYKTKWVKTNNYDATYEATVVCINKGYKKFILITADPSLLSTRKERTSGYIDALLDNDLVYEKLIVEDNDENNPKKILDFLVKHINGKEKELIFVPNCWALPMVFIALKDYYFLMPDLGLMGFDNTEWTNFATPSITTIVQPAFKEGQQAASILIDQIESKNDENGQQVLECIVNWNESTL
ncbi:LacI family DNA-binding transcriptional regulator [Clostridium estertheticum]|uniref:LacI family DNA-binding transcriptional regulator n=1 Tax=Clostridium estertheticum TaxID=238834 RepID=UPI001CF23F13|nr:LacI family DNA-binding transcriptional regulator [Clostridium estertheticum]MCB2307646.1 LacI family DNA-binding transcriptional regulator [Clostridium estertheticum]MCB2346771.1 LacI family DNA-binding transcriptional regulator [Clostridium estertheticum]MCB2351136.1 LacI family DNA-binding transcriptional regulator [Clostridium estertheticum]WAG46651.1 LacI family DNA-binding transcriptional regulator [Clostridium estertheticum]